MHFQQTSSPRIPEERRCTRSSVSPCLASSSGGGASAASAKTVALDEVDAFLAIDASGRVTLYSGKVDLGTGVCTALDTDRWPRNSTCRSTGSRSSRVTRR